MEMMATNPTGDQKYGDVKLRVYKRAARAGMTAVGFWLLSSFIGARPGQLEAKRPTACRETWLNQSEHWAKQPETNNKGGQPG
jgi:hypothetical protein